LLNELGRTAENANVIYEDNQGAIALANNPEHHAQTKHIDVQYHFVRDSVENERIKSEYCPTAEMVADALTKPLARVRHQEMMEMMGLEDMSNTVSPNAKRLQSRSGSVGSVERSRTVDEDSSGLRHAD
jgi:hypothetical protein